MYYAMAAVGAGKIDEALTELSEARHLDPEAAWGAAWILTRAKRDWNAARVLLADRESGERTLETKILRTRLEWEAGGVRESILADLRNDPKTVAEANVLAFEDALEKGRFAEASEMKGLPEVHALYAAEAGILAGKPANADLKDPFSVALREAAEGRRDASSLLERAAENGVLSRSHVWFALAVRAAATGDRAGAARLFRKSAERALDRQFPYYAALELAARYGRESP
jgi:hypothetical protein